jgi:hypothetical protein
MHRDEPVSATASQVSAWLLVEVNGPWGRDAIQHSELSPHAPLVWREAMRRQGIRVIAIRRDLTHHHDAGPRSARLVHVIAPRPGVGTGSAHRRTVAHLHDVVSATASIAAGHGHDDGWEPDDDRYVLVCTNGRHDPCCATYGRPIVRGLRETKWADDVWECSHIGGDRFAGNVVVLPDSLYFGRLDLAAAQRVLDAHDCGRLDLDGFRGRSTFRLPEQAAEHFVRRELGLDALDAVRSVERVDDERLRVEVDVDGQLATYDVAVERTAVPAPTPLTCTGKHGLSYPAFHLRDLMKIHPSV